ncbi:unnamed protein product [Meganyctiphanes norvegica]|uniref:1-acylglycerol-3-phosphate O-acyltransferase ABHD5 n=1 Tax=Meganyctiphanes norvegica TaxID=48144 RepID=A0AAV2QDF2_MEGNR
MKALNLCCALIIILLLTQNVASRRDYTGLRKEMSDILERENVNGTQWPLIYSDDITTESECYEKLDPQQADPCSSDSNDWLGWMYWCTTSITDLRTAEDRLLENLKDNYNRSYVNIGCVMGSEELHVWTLKMNEASNNTPLVMLHGFAAGVGLWILNLDDLAKHRPVYAIDILGFGSSSRPKFSSDPIEAERELLNSIEAWRKAVGLEKFILMGHSFGGFLAASYAIKYPERISHLVLADAWGLAERPPKSELRAQYPFWKYALASVMQNVNPLAMVRAAGSYGPKMLKRTRPDIIRKYSGVVEDAETVIPNYIYHCNAQNPSGEEAFHTIMSGFRWAKYPIITRIDALREDIAVTFIYGAKSWIDKEPPVQIKELRTNSYVDIQFIPDSGHHVYADHPEDFNTSLNQVCAKVDSGSLVIPIENSTFL